MSANAKALQFNKLKVAYSWKCNAACDHCAVCSSPERGEVLDDRHVYSVIRAAIRCGIKEVEFTGGEIFLFYRKLLSFMEAAHEGNLITVLNTNAVWAKSVEPAVRRLTRLKAVGLAKMVLSTDRYHQAFIPLARVANALKAARKLEIPAAVTICFLKKDLSILETIAALHPFTSNIKLQPVTPFGRSAETLPRGQMQCASFSSAGRPCGQLTQPAPTINPDGRVSICCAPPMWLPGEHIEFSPLVLGRLDHEPLDEILQRAQENELLALLASQGAAGIIEEARQLDPELYRPRADGYYGACDLCMKTFGSQSFVNGLQSLKPALLKKTGQR